MDSVKREIRLQKGAMECKIDEIESKIQALIDADMESKEIWMEKKMESKLLAIVSKITEMENKVTSVESKMSAMDSKMESKMDKILELLLSQRAGGAHPA